MEFVRELDLDEVRKPRTNSTEHMLDGINPSRRCNVDHRLQLESSMHDRWNRRLQNNWTHPSSVSNWWSQDLLNRIDHELVRDRDS